MPAGAESGRARYIAIITDGNGRWARERGLPVILPFALPRTVGEEGRGRAYVAALIRRAIGYGVKLGGGGA